MCSQSWKEGTDFRSSPSRGAVGASANAAAEGLAGRVQQWLRTRAPRERRLRLVETLVLGQRRSIALIEVDGLRFLAGMGSDSVSTLVPLAGVAEGALTEVA